MGRVKIRDIRDFFILREEKPEHATIKTSRSTGRTEFCYYKCDIDFDFDYMALTMMVSIIKNVLGYGLLSTLKFIDCDFLQGISIKDRIIEFQDWESDEDSKEHNPTLPMFKAFEFKECNFSSIDFSESSINLKMRFTQSKFNTVNFNNTKFQDLADFWRCDFHESTTFYKTDFLGTTVFSGSIFHENVLFTYSLIKKLIIFRGTKFYNGLDLALAIIPGEISCFDIDLAEFKTIHIKKLGNKHDSEEAYENAVTYNHKIPINNARETFRILKQTLISQNNISDSIKFKVLEKKALQKEIAYQRQDEKEKSKEGKGSRNEVLRLKLEQFNLWLNEISNKHGSSYGQAFKYLSIVSIPLFYLSIICHENYTFSLQMNNWDWQVLGKYFEFLLPTHKFDYLAPKSTGNLGYYFFDFLGRILGGYGFYQFIQAFRKYR